MKDDGAPVEIFVPRRAIERTGDGTTTAARPLAAWCWASAYVLLAEPGAGKTEAFRAEAAATNGGEYITARNFIALGPKSSSPETILFIDGLDEMRAGSTSRRQPLEEIRMRLNKLGRPRFRISCREADWLGAVDTDALRAVAPNGELNELHLLSLEDEDIVSILEQLPTGPPDAPAFLREAARRGMRPLLGNPLLLKLMVEAVSGDQWPGSRADLYRRACEQLGTEYNAEHRLEHRGPVPSMEVLLDDAGLLAAVLLLSGTEGFVSDPSIVDATAVRVETLAADLGLRDSGAALSSKLFVADGERRVPLHRTIAEYLASRATAARVKTGLPIGRVLALMSGLDGGIVEPLRGLHAWLAVQCPSERSHLIDRDPLGLVLYGDLTAFTTADKKRVLEALHREAQRFVWFRQGHWDAHPFGALATEDMVSTFCELLAAPDRELAHQSLLDCVIDAIEHTNEPKAMERVLPALEKLIRDITYRPGLRADALNVWLQHATTDALRAGVLLDAIRSGSVSDSDDELTGLLLTNLYPAHVTPAAIMSYFHRPARESLYGAYRHFWTDALVKQTPKDQLPMLAVAWAEARADLQGKQWDFDLNRISGRLLAATVEAHGEVVPVERLYRWLDAGIEEHGFATLSGDDATPLANWLSAHPHRQKALVAYGWTKVRQDASTGRRFFWESENRLFRSARPADWYDWLLDEAASTADEELARYCFDHSAHAAINRPPGFDITMKAVEHWVAKHQAKWPQAPRWLEDAWSVPLDDWQRDEFRRKVKYEDKQTELRRERRLHIAPYIEDIKGGTAPPGLMMQLAHAYDERYTDIRGETPEARVQDFLGGTRDEAAAAIDGLAATPTRYDLPSVEDILKADLDQRHHYLRPACLLGARLAHERDPETPLLWSEDLARRLIAFCLTEGIGEPPSWYGALATKRPAWVASVLIPYAVQRIRKRSQNNVAGLWSLAQNEGQTQLARLVLPELLTRFPARANEAQLRTLNGDLLRAAVLHLEPPRLMQETERRLSMKSIDAGQRIAWHVAGLSVDAEKFSQLLVDFVGTSQSRAAQLAFALEQQAGRRRSASAVPAVALGRLIELIAMHSSPEHPEGAFWVGDADRRRDLVNEFLNQLAAQASPDAASVLDRLRAMPALKRWKLGLDAAAYSQQRVAWEAGFQHPSVDEAAQTLANKAPANPLDLAALVLDHLRGLQARLHGDDTNGLKQFRRDDGRSPKVENDCRDLLLAALRDRLERVEVHLEAEARAAREKRADMRAQFFQAGRRFAVPIEIKKEDHDALWSAWRTQLKTLYSIDPAAGGVGVYLVLWFGVKVTASPAGVRPTTPQQLQEQLTGSIDVEDRTRLSVQVLDLSLPAPSGNGSRATLDLMPAAPTSPPTS